VFLDRELERKAELKLSEWTNEESETRKGALMGKRFNVVPLCNIKSHFVSIDSGVLYCIMKEICPEFDVRKIEFTGENRETCCKIIFDFKSVRLRKKTVCTGIIESEWVCVCVHNRRLKVNHLVPSSLAPSAKREENNETRSGTHDPQENDSVAGADPGNTNIVTIAAPFVG